MNRVKQISLHGIILENMPLTNIQKDIMMKAMLWPLLSTKNRTIMVVNLPVSRMFKAAMQLRNKVCR